MANRMILNETSYFGEGSISEIVTEAKKRAFKKALVVTDPDLIKFNVAKNVTDLLEEAGLAYDIFSQVKANPTVKVVKAGIEAFKAAGADYLIAIGGGSSMDTAKAIGIIINNPEYAGRESGIRRGVRFRECEARRNRLYNIIRFSISFCVTACSQGFWLMRESN